MKKILFCFLAVIWVMMLVPASVNSQSILNKAKQKIRQRTDAKVDKAMNDGLDKVENKNPKTGEETNAGEKTESAASTGGATSGSAMTFSTKYDFVPGDKVIAFEDFGKTEIGDFPLRWNTNATAEVVTLNNKEGKWLKISKEGVFHPEFITNLPDNFTLEFDLGVNEGWRGTHMAVNFANLTKPEEFTSYYHFVSWKGNYAVHLQFKPGLSERTDGVSHMVAGNNGNHVINNDVGIKNWNNSSNNFAHISLWRQAQRLRVYVNGEKIWDIPRAFDQTSKFNAVTFGMQGSYGTDDYMLLGNVRLAVGAADTRNKLITEGKFVTRGILFDVNSDKIKPESAGALRDIANVLKENPSVKVKIVGHTDADGDDAANMELSKKRAAAVKNFLINEHSIPSENLETDGKGETQPADTNPTAEGKANNRRVEFIKV